MTELSCTIEHHDDCRGAATFTSAKAAGRCGWHRVYQPSSSGSMAPYAVIAVDTSCGACWPEAARRHQLDETTGISLHPTEA